MSDPDTPIALEAYEALARRYSDLAETKAENGFNEHPAMRAQIGDVAGPRILDAGCGPGFLTRDLLDKGAAELAAFDISPAMIEVARERVGARARLFVADMAQPLPWPANGHFDLVVSSLAIDYVRDWSVPLSEFRRVLKPGGRLAVLEFSHMTAPALQAAYDTYSYNVIPRLGSLVAGDKESYQYLVESIRQFPDQETFRAEMESAGFSRVSVTNFSGGIAALHFGWAV